MKKEYLHIRIDKDKKEELQKIAKKIGISLSSLIMLAIDKVKELF